MKKDTIILILASLALAVIGILSLNKIKKQDQQLSNINTQLDLNEADFAQETQVGNKQKDQTMPATLSANKSVSKPDMIIDQTKNYQVTLKTSVGNIVIALNAQATPITVNNFVYLAEQGFYDQTIFHRVINDFMIQGGDPRGDGTGGPGYKFNDEAFEGEYSRGTVAMANAGPNTNGSQFFIMHQDNALPKNYVIFGQVIEGMEVVDAIATAPVAMSLSGEQSRPIEAVVVESALVEER